MKTFSYRTHPHSLPTQAIQMSVEEVNCKKEGEPVVCDYCKSEILTNLTMVDDRVYCSYCAAKYVLPCCQELGVSY